MTASQHVRRRLLPLLPQLSVLLDERHISRAARRVGVTQPTMSRTLALARELLDDQLLLRGSQGALLTPRGQALRSALGAMLTGFDELFQTPTFEPQAVRTSVRIAATDYVCQTLLPRLVAVLRRSAPGLELDLVPWTAEALQSLEADRVQLALNPLGSTMRGLYRRRLFDDRYAVILAKSSALARGALSLRRYVEAAHVLTITEDGGIGVVDRALRRQRKRRHVAVRVRDFVSAAAIVGGSDLVATVPARLAARVQSQFGLLVRDPPLALPTIGVDLIWHERRHRDPVIAWLRQQLIDHRDE